MTDIRDLGLRAGTRNTLLRHGIDTTDTLYKFTEAQLLGLAHFGRVSLLDLRRNLRRVSLPDLAIEAPATCPHCGKELPS